MKKILKKSAAALAELREEGTLKEISEKYLGGDYTNSAYSN